MVAAVGGAKRAAMLGVAVLLIALAASGALAQATPPEDANPDELGVSGAVLGALPPAAAPGHRL